MISLEGCHSYSHTLSKTYNYICSFMMLAYEVFNKYLRKVRLRFFFLKHVRFILRKPISIKMSREKKIIEGVTIRKWRDAK